MKKPLLILSMFLVLSAWGGSMTVKPLVIRKLKMGAVGFDAKAGSGSYFTGADEKAGSATRNGTLMIVAGAVIVLGGAGALLLRRRK